MRGVILAGGLGTRLYPITHATNKHLLPVYNKPMIFYPIETLLKAGITEIMIVVSDPHSGHFIKVLKNGKELGLKHLEYAYQSTPDGGIADALSYAEDFADGHNIAVILGDNTTDADIKDEVDFFDKQPFPGAKVFLKDVPDPKRFGVPVFSEDNNLIIAIEEKPENPKSKYAVTGLYLYDKTVFDKIRASKPSDRGELEITSVNNLYIQEERMSHASLNGYWGDAGTFDSLYEANKYWYLKTHS